MIRDSRAFAHLVLKALVLLHLTPPGACDVAGGAGSVNALPASISGSRVLPTFDQATPRNVTALVGKSAYLSCRVKNLGNRTCSEQSCDRDVAAASRVASVCRVPNELANMSHTKFSDDEDNRLIQLVEQNPSLYDAQCELYKDGYVRDNVWRGIALRLNKSDEECKKRWKYIRDSYNRYKRKRKSISSSVPPAKNSKWEFYQKVMFLENIPSSKNIDGSTDVYPDSPFVQPSSSTGSQSHKPSTSHEFISCHNDQLDSIDESHYEANQTPSFSGDTIAKPLRNTKHRDYFLDLLKNKEDNQFDISQDLNQAKTDEADDDVNTFGDHVKCVLKKLSPRLKIRAKNDIFSILTKYETMNMGMEEDKQDNSLLVKLEL